MKVTKEKQDNSQVLLKVEAEPEETAAYLDKAYRKLVNRVLVPGFRKGKTPRPILERHIGKEALLQEAMEHMVPELYAKALQDQDVPAVDEPEVKIVKTDPVTFEARVPVRPTAELGDYKNIRVPLETTGVKDEQVESYISSLRERHALWEPVERPVEIGDRVTQDLQGTIDGKKLINEKGLQLTLAKDSQIIAPGFTEQIVGMAPGQEKDFELRFPEDFPNKELAGKSGAFKSKVNEIKVQKLAELNDEFAKSLNWGLETMDALKARVREDIGKAQDSINQRHHESQVLEAATAASKVEYPAVLVEREIDQLISDRLRYSGTDDLESYLADAKKTQEELRDEVREEARRRVLNTVVLHEIAEQEKVEVPESEIDNEIENAIRMNAGRTTEAGLTEMRKQLNTPVRRESVRNSIRQRKTLDILSKMARTSPTAPSAAKGEEKTADAQ